MLYKTSTSLIYACICSLLIPGGIVGHIERQIKSDRSVWLVCLSFGVNNLNTDCSYFTRDVSCTGPCGINASQAV